MLVYGPLKNRFGLSRIRVGYTAGEAIGPEIFRFYRSLGINLKQLYGQTEASVYITAQPDGEIYADTVGKPTPTSRSRSPRTARCCSGRPACSSATTRTRKRPPRPRRRTAGCAPAMPASSTQDRAPEIIDRAKDVGRLNDGTLFAPKYIENKLKFYPNIKEAVAIGDGRDYVSVMLNIDLVAVGSWAERNNVGLRLLSGARRASARLRHAREACRRGEPVAVGRGQSWRARRSGASSSCTRSSTPTTAS